MSRLRAVPQTPRRAIGYVRVSMAREEMVSPELQRAAIEGYCDQRGYVLADVIEELDVTGRNFARRGVQEAIERIEAKAADVIVVWKVSRFGRTRRDWYVHADRVEVAGGSLESATEHFDPLTSTGRLTRGMLVELAAWESDVKSEQWKEAQAHRLRAGLPHTPTPRFGYTYDKDVKAYAVDPVTGPLLAEAYSRYLAGQTPQQICDWLNDLGVPTTRGNPWQAETMRWVLRSGFGAGLVLHDGEHLPGAHEPVIDKRTWERFQRKRSEAAKQAPRVRQGKHPLTGLMVCGRCGKSMTHRVNVSTYKGKPYPGYPVYACPIPRRGGCGRCTIVESAVWEKIRSWLEAEVAADVDQRAEVKARQASKRALAKTDRAAIGRQLAEVERSLSRAFEGWARGLTSETSYQAAREALEAEKRVLESRLGEVTEDLDALRVNVRPLARSLVRDLDRLRTETPAGLREVLHQLIREIEVAPGRGRAERVTITPRWA